MNVGEAEAPVELKLKGHVCPRVTSPDRTKILETLSQAFERYNRDDVIKVAVDMECFRDLNQNAPLSPIEQLEAQTLRLYAETMLNKYSQGGGHQNE